jgi:hypothetical protein
MPKLTADEIDRLIARPSLVRVATVGADGWPMLVPVAYLYIDGEILLTAREKVSWLENIRRDPRVCLTIDENRYPLAKVTIQGEAEIRHEPGEDDLWRDRRLPLDGPTPPAPRVVHDDGTEEWSYAEAYHAMTHDEPRALVVVNVAASKVTSWRLPTEGEYVDESWASRYFKNEPRRFRVIETGPSLDKVRVVTE